MVCPYCHKNTRVSNSRPSQAGFSTWRRRHCQNCKITFTTSEQILVESTIVFKDADGALQPLRRADIYISVFKALGGSKSGSEAAERLTSTCIDKLFKQRVAVLNQNIVEKYIFETLNAYQPLAGQRYLLNDLKRSAP